MTCPKCRGRGLRCPYCGGADLDQKPFIICDLDGTLANIDHRIHHIQKEPKDWDSFFMGIPDDKVNGWCFTIVKALIELAFHPIFITGRDEAYRKESESWLIRHGFYDFHLYMRPSGDSRPDGELKASLWESHKHKHGTAPLFVLEDSPSCVRMWRERGFTCLQPNFSDHLAKLSLEGLKK